MKRQLISILIVSLLTVLCGCRKEDDSGDQIHRLASTHIDSLYLLHAGEEWDSLFNTGQIERLADIYDQDVVSMPFDAPTLKGRLALKADFENFLAYNNQARHETFIEEILLKDTSWAIERAQYRLTYTPKPKTEPVIETGRHVLCRKKRDGRWQIVWEIWNADKPRAINDRMRSSASANQPAHNRREHDVRSFGKAEVETVFHKSRYSLHPTLEPQRK